MSTEKESEHTYTGRVKWFNNKAGYGFITITDGDKAGTDVFVHHSNVVVASEQYKYLVQGEYVSFSMVRIEGDKHEFQAHNVTGVKGGTLMCETRFQQRVERSTYRKSNKTNDQEEEKEQKQWTYVSRVKKENNESKLKAKSNTTESYAPRERQPAKQIESETKPKASEQEKKKRGRPAGKKQPSSN
jgi:CspA family cold shock protein